MVSRKFLAKIAVYVIYILYTQYMDILALKSEK